MICSKDDSGIPCKDCWCKYTPVVAVMPVYGRHPLIKHTIRRLLKKNKCTHVVCAGDIKDKQVCERAGAIFIEHANYPLGEKWNAAFLKAQQLNAAAVLFLGSSDWVSDNWLQRMLPYLDKYDMAGKAGCYLLDIRGGNKFKLVYWSGYKNGSGTEESAIKRANESIGIGRVISKRGLDKIGWKPFDDNQDNSLDWTMYMKLKNNILVEDDTIHSMAISTDKWPNKHTFKAHWKNIYPSQKISDLSFCKRNFPEYDKIF